MPLHRVFAELSRSAIAGLLMPSAMSVQHFALALAEQIEIRRLPAADDRLEMLFGGKFHEPDRMAGAFDVEAAGLRRNAGPIRPRDRRRSTRPGSARGQTSPLPARPRRARCRRPHRHRVSTSPAWIACASFRPAAAAACRATSSAACAALVGPSRRKTSFSPSQLQSRPPSGTITASALSRNCSARSPASRSPRPVGRTLCAHYPGHQQGGEHAVPAGARTCSGQELLDRVGDALDVAGPDRMVAAGQLDQAGALDLLRQVAAAAGATLASSWRWMTSVGVRTFSSTPLHIDVGVHPRQRHRRRRRCREPLEARPPVAKMRIVDAARREMLRARRRCPSPSRCRRRNRASRSCPITHVWKSA